MPKKLGFIIALILSLIIAYAGGYARPYPAFGGEDLIPIMVIIVYICKYLTYKENERKKEGRQYEA